MIRKVMGAFIMSCLAFGASSAHAAATATAYDFVFKTLSDEQPMPLAAYRGQVLLIVNTASRCGFTDQYAGLEKLYQLYQAQGLVIIGVPSNDFGGQEPGSNAEIATFCKLNYGVTFPLAAKEVVTGAQAHPFYRWAKDTLGFAAAPKWNFHKYLINRRGQLVDYFHSTTSPDAAKIKRAIKAALQES